MKRILATLAVSVMMVTVPTTAAMAARPSSGDSTCNSKGANKGGTCNVTIIEGDDNHNGTIELGESFCKNKQNGSYSLVNLQTVVCLGGVVISVL
ncbi:MAG: hypothetical protein ABIS21_00935 [Acidimicrobiales bacterium]